MQKKYAAKGFTVVSVSSDENPAEAGAFAKEIKATFPVVHDVKGTVSEKYGVLGLPANLVIDRKGKIVYSAEGSDVKGLTAAVTKTVAAR